VSAWDEAGVALVLSSIVTMAFAVLAARLAFAMPRDLQANWVFRVIPDREGSAYMAARRTALVVTSVVPVWGVWAGVFFAQWPWQSVLGHLGVLACLGMVFVELALTGPLKIPCTCSYLPGKSQLHLAFIAAVILLVGFVRQGARYELDVLQRLTPSAALIGTLVVVYGLLWWRTRLASDTWPVFDQENSDEPVDLQLWDSRMSPNVK
jgi:hypothetical protein